MDLGLSGRVAVVTGASRGIGRTIALTLAHEGARLAVCARGEGPLREAAAAFAATGADVLPVVADVTEDADVARLFDRAIERWGRVDALVSNVGKALGGPFLDTSESDWRDSFEQTFFSTLRCAKRAAEIMRQQRGGCMVFIASIFGREVGGLAPYNAAKAAQISLAKTLSRELAPYNIRVNSVAPGSILFPGGSWQRRLDADPQGIADFVRREIPRGQFGSVEEVASVVAFLCSDRASHVTGACWTVDGGQSRSLI